MPFVVCLLPVLVGNMLFYCLPSEQTGPCVGSRGSFIKTRHFLALFRLCATFCLLKALWRPGIYTTRLLWESRPKAIIFVMLLWQLNKFVISGPVKNKQTASVWLLLEKPLSRVYSLGHNWRGFIWSNWIVVCLVVIRQVPGSNSSCRKNAVA